MAEPKPAQLNSLSSLFLLRSAAASGRRRRHPSLPLLFFFFFSSSSHITVLVFANGLKPPPAHRNRSACCRRRPPPSFPLSPFLFSFLFFLPCFSLTRALSPCSCSLAAWGRRRSIMANRPTASAGLHPLSSSLFFLLSYLFFLPLFSASSPVSLLPSLRLMAQRLDRPSPGRLATIKTIRANRRRPPFRPDGPTARHRVPSDYIRETQPCDSQISPRVAGDDPLSPGWSRPPPLPGHTAGGEGPCWACHLRPCRRLSPAAAPLLRPGCGDTRRSCQWPPPAANTHCRPSKSTGLRKGRWLPGGG